MVVYAVWLVSCFSSAGPAIGLLAFQTGSRLY
ncbi:hypothetical protein predicted by Glimmer/Critica [Acetobacter senegalensis]|uniref:Uncharacterized protein n=1 Tax=Acetobacter senegalensis TaxID=446692 RepID=A0A0U5ETW6_9PROT|nr:hypothetical protein predicted by Glimmer/Critica [Acetobacter senegalensis]